MKIRFNTTVLLVAALGLISIQAKADDVVYDNGPIDGTVQAWTINYGFVVSDSFNVSSPASLTSARVGLWSNSDPVSLDWSIGTSAYGSEIASGTAALTNTPAGSNFGYSLFDSVFAINGLVTGGTYYFTLQNAVASNSGDPVYWDQNNGPSLAFENTLGQIEGSQSFTLYSKSTNSVPDSSATIALLGGALSGLALIRRRLMS